MKKTILFLCLLFAMQVSAQSIDPVSLLIAKVIRAIDLKVQKLQNQTIWLQQAQQVAEYELSKTKLAEIKDWQNKQEELYAAYFKELLSVKAVVKTLPQIRQIISMQGQVVSEYGRFAKNATRAAQYEELLGLSKEILASLDILLSSKGLSMRDADRLLKLTTLRDAMSECLDRIRQLNKEYIRINANSLRIKADLQFIQKLNRKP